MSVLDWLKITGSRFGLLRFVSTDSPAPPERVPTRVVTLRDLAVEVDQEQVCALAELPVEVSQPFEKVFEAAGVKPPPHGWTIEKLRQRLGALDLKELPRAEVQKALLQMLTADEAHVQDLVRDAMARDRALDAFEVSVEAKMRARAADRRSRVREMEERVKELQEAIGRLRDEAGADEAGWQDWHARKVACEKGMAWALSFLLDEPVVTIDIDPAADLGSAL